MARLVAKHTLPRGWREALDAHGRVQLHFDARRRPGRALRRDQRPVGRRPETTMYHRQKDNRNDVSLQGACSAQFANRNPRHRRVRTSASNGKTRSVERQKTEGALQGAPQHWPPGRGCAPARRSETRNQRHSKRELSTSRLGELGALLCTKVVCGGLVSPCRIQTL